MSKTKLNINPSQTVLVVDDNKKNLQVVGNILHEKKYKIVFAKDGPSALKLAKTIHPELILLDIMMPGMDGYEVCEKLKKDKSTNEIPIIFLTAKTETRDIVKGFEKGGSDYIMKPFQTEELLARVKTHLELKNSKDIIAQQAENLSIANATKDHLFSIISHDLKGPLSGIQNLLNLFLVQSREGEDISEADLNILKSSADKIVILLQNLLEWSRSQQNRIEINKEELDITELVNETIDLMKTQADEKQLRIISSLKPVTVIADANTLKTVLRNLVHNAIKFSPRGEKIKVSHTIKDKEIEISVIDNGVGMNNEAKNKIFDEYKHHSTYGTNQEKGSGLGLKLCQDFVQRNGGRIWVESQEGKGSSFTFTMEIKQ